MLDDAVMETYIETDDVPADEIHRVLRSGNAFRAICSRRSAERR